MPSSYSFLKPQQTRHLPHLEGKPIRLFIDSGYMGPGPTYLTMDLARQLLGANFIPQELFVIDYAREINPAFNAPAATHLKNYIARYHREAYRFEVSDFYKCLSTFQEASIWLTGFSFLTPEDISIYYQRYNIAAGTVIMACNGVFGTPSFYSIKLENGSWHHEIIQKTLPSSLPPYDPSPKPIKRLILNNPFNWHGPQHPHALLLNILQVISHEALQQILIVCANEIQKSELKQLCLNFNAQIPALGEKVCVLGPNDIRLKDNLTPTDLVISEGLGLLEDCLKSCALGIQILNPNTKKIVSIYDHLLRLVRDPQDMFLLTELNNQFTNFSTVLKACLLPQYRSIFFRYRENLIAAPGENTFDVLIENFRHFMQTEKSLCSLTGPQK